ncbi:hypothetical protein CPT_Mana_033 [Burkholderia phage Mana]|uniref:Uncharacterized protein n=1 Tax=Burkholderia phage Mana TaxID=2767578 RepID=A0A873WH36_9CAUD|nr:hypothetical protein KNV21_gp33 [Burkholderia phage Mana]QPB09428.1 hypothetical protein CPT_Mana_033 [Burkholderia phage Mana]
MKVRKTPNFPGLAPDHPSPAEARITATTTTV